MNKIVCWYEYHPDTNTHLAVAYCKEKNIALHFWASCREPNYQWYGGLETHYGSPPDYMKEDKPSQEHCRFLGKPCWHDGTSLYAHEVLIPVWRGSVDGEKPGTIEDMLNIIRNKFIEKFGE